MASHADKLLRILSLVAFLLAARTRVSRQDVLGEVEGYGSFSNDEAFARRFYADRAMLGQLGFVTTNRGEGDDDDRYSLSRSAVKLSDVGLTRGEIDAVYEMLDVLEDGFPYADVLKVAVSRLAGHRLAPGRRQADEPGIVSLAPDPEGSPHALDHVEKGITRGKVLELDYVTALGRLEKDVVFRPCRVVWHHGEYLVVGTDAEGAGFRTLRVASVGKVSFHSRAERDHDPDEDVLPEVDFRRPAWAWGPAPGTARVRIPSGLHRVMRRRYGDRFGSVAEQDGNEVVVETLCSDPELLVAWTEGVGPPASVLSIVRADGRNAAIPKRLARDRADVGFQVKAGSVEPPRLIQLLTLAGVLLNADGPVSVEGLCRLTSQTEAQLRVDLGVLGLANFGGGNYILFAEIEGDEVVTTPEAHSQLFTAPVGLVDLELQALLTALDLMAPVMGRQLRSVRAKVARTLCADGDDPSLVLDVPSAEDARRLRLVIEAVQEGHALEIERYDPIDDDVETCVVEPLGLVFGQGGWAVRAEAAGTVATYPLDEIEQVGLAARAPLAGQAASLAA